jgi:hypothetical protein
VQLSTISPYRYINLTIHTLFSPPRGAICSLPRSVKFPTWTAFLGAAALHVPYMGQNHAWCRWAVLIGAIKCTNQNPKNTGAGQNFRVPRPSVCWHLNRRISTGSCRMKTTKWSYIIESSRLFIFRSQFFFLRSSSSSTVYFNVMMTSPHQASS